MTVVYPGGSQQHYGADSEPVWQPQYGSRLDSETPARGYPSVNGTMYVDDGYGGELDSMEPGFTQQQVNGGYFVRLCVGHMTFVSISSPHRPCPRN